jgi:hypothetical protein
MKPFALILGVLVEAFSTQAHAEYQTYAQSNQTGLGHSTEVLVLVLDPASPKSKNDTALCHLTLRPGETQTKIVGNKFFPGRTYSFTVTFKRPIITIIVVISENGHELFHSNQSFASWKGF